MLPSIPVSSKNVETCNASLVLNVWASIMNQLVEKEGKYVVDLDTPRVTVPHIKMTAKLYYLQTRFS